MDNVRTTRSARVLQVTPLNVWIIGFVVANVFG